MRPRPRTQRRPGWGRPQPPGRAVPAAAPLPRRQELSESASALPRHGGPAPGSLPARCSRRLAPPALTCRAAARRPPEGRSRPARISPAAQPRGSPHAPEPPGPGCGAGAAGSCSPATPPRSGAPRGGELQPPARPPTAGRSRRDGACALLPDGVSVTFLARGGGSPESLTGRLAAYSRHPHLASPHLRCPPGSRRAGVRPRAVRPPWRSHSSSRRSSSCAPRLPPSRGPPPPPSPGPLSAPLSVHLSGRRVARRSAAAMSPRPRTRPFGSAQEMLDRVCHRIAPASLPPR